MKRTTGYPTPKLLMIFLVLSISIISISATNNIDNTQAQFGNTKINNTDMYYNDGNSYRGVSSGTADVIYLVNYNLNNCGV